MNDISTMLPPLGKSGGAGEQLRAGTDGAREELFEAIQEEK